MGQMRYPSGLSYYRAGERGGSLKFPAKLFRTGDGCHIMVHSHVRLVGEVPVQVGRLCRSVPVQPVRRARQESAVIGTAGGDVMAGRSWIKANEYTQTTERPGGAC